MSAAAESIQELFGNVEKKVLQKMVEEQSKVVHEMLLDQLKDDFNSKWEPTLSLF